MPENINEEALKAIKTMHEKIDKHGTDSVEVKAFIEKTEEVFEKQEKSNQELIAANAEADKKALDLEEKIDGLEVELARKGAAGSVNYKDEPEYKALNLFCKKGAEALDMDQKALLRSDSDTQGGYLTSVEMDTEIIKKITELSPVRQVARVRTVGRKTLEIPKRDGILEATYEGETVAATDSVSNYGSETLTTFRLTTNVPFTNDMLLDSGFDIESEIMQDVTEAFAFKEGNKFVLGNATKEPEGFLVNAEVVAGAIETEGSGVISSDDLLNVTGELKTGYNPMFAFNRRTLADLRQLKGTTNDHYLWQVSLREGAPNTIGGMPYVLMEDMPANGVTGNLAVIYADFARGYTIIDRTGMAVIRDEFTRKKENIVELTFHRYNTGQVVLAEAFQALKIKA